jgi:hypothetical protein
VCSHISRCLFWRLLEYCASPLVLACFALLFWRVLAYFALSLACEVAGVRPFVDVSWFAVWKSLLPHHTPPQSTTRPHRAHSGGLCGHFLEMNPGGSTWSSLFATAFLSLAVSPNSSPLTPHPSPLTPHPSPLTPHPSPIWGREGRPLPCASLPFISSQRHLVQVQGVFEASGVKGEGRALRGEGPSVSAMHASHVIVASASCLIRHRGIRRHSERQCVVAEMATMRGG